MSAHNRALALALAQEVLAEVKACYRNSVLALFALRAQDAVQAIYVEGVLVILAGQLPIEHGWLEVDGCIVDPTLHDEAAENYYPVVRYSRAEVEAKMRGRLTLPLFSHSTKTRKEMTDVLFRLLDPDHA